MSTSPSSTQATPGTSPTPSLTGVSEATMKADIKKDPDANTQEPALKSSPLATAIKQQTEDVGSWHSILDAATALVKIEVGTDLRSNGYLVARYGSDRLRGLGATYHFPESLISRCPKLLESAKTTKLGSATEATTTTPAMTRSRKKGPPPKKKAKRRIKDEDIMETNTSAASTEEQANSTVSRAQSSIKTISLGDALPQVLAELVKYLDGENVMPTHLETKQWAQYYHPVDAQDVAVGICQLGVRFGEPAFHDCGIDMLEWYHSLGYFSASSIALKVASQCGADSQVSKYVVMLCVLTDLKKSGMIDVTKFAIFPELMQEYTLQFKKIMSSGKNKSNKMGKPMVKLDYPARKDYYAC